MESPEAQRLEIADKHFFGPEAGWSPREVWKVTDDALTGFDDGELFLEYREDETLGMEDGVLRQAGFTRSSGFGLRAVSGAQTLFAHSDLLDLASLKRAAGALGTGEAARPGGARVAAFLGGPVPVKQALYTPLHPLAEGQFGDRAALLGEIDAFARALDPRVVQVNATLHSQWQVIQIMRPSALAGTPSVEASLANTPLVDIRPLVRLDITVMAESDGRRESGHTGAGGRYALARLSAPGTWQEMAREALRLALVKLEAAPAPAGEMPIVLGAGWPGILLHEAVGHGLEGDFNRKGTSVFSDMIGKRVAAPGVTVVDDGTIPERRGSLRIDDEGTPTARTVLIEDGILSSYLQDRLNARLTGQRLTGNGRRQSYAHAPLPRMTNTVMTGGAASEEEMIRSTKRGLYAVNFGGGQVDITSGKFVFATSEAYLIEDGKITRPVRGATLIGSGRDVMNGIEMIGPEMALDPGIGTCGKAGQGVPVGVGQPMLKVGGLTVGGSAT